MASIISTATSIFYLLILIVSLILGVILWQTLIQYLRVKTEYIEMKIENEETKRETDKIKSDLVKIESNLKYRMEHENEHIHKEPDYEHNNND